MAAKFRKDTDAPRVPAQSLAQDLQHRFFCAPDQIDKQGLISRGLLQIRYFFRCKVVPGKASLTRLNPFQIATDAAIGRSGYAETLLTAVADRNRDLRRFAAPECFGGPICRCTYFQI